ncbi:hypothetical protein [Nocardia aurantia]|uniref:DUF8020 domain-containing protein n=1 Tax=Nocardia aurantia TaxID=2585199 RepID=A0A7K0E055_9NOCA|nr:hypothetical protein [Nocardia aurantia]MQY30902.1 hypothetical protein [Nocardia aurantia]
MRKFTVSLALVISAATIAGGVANADPAPAQQLAQPIATDVQDVDANGVHYTVGRDGDAVVLTSENGSFQAVDGSLVVSDGDGAAVDSLPLSYNKDNVAFPIAAQIDGGNVRLTPATTGGVPADIAQAQHTTESFTPRDQQELSAFSSRASIASTTGAIIGAIVGGGIGCIAGAVVGSVSTAITTLFAGVLPGAVVGCIAGVATIGAVGTLAGAALVAGPIVLWSAYQYFSTITAPCTGPGAYCVDPAAPKAPDAK